MRRIKQAYITCQVTNVLHLMLQALTTWGGENGELLINEKHFYN